MSQITTPDSVAVTQHSARSVVNKQHNFNRIVTILSRATIVGLWLIGKYSLQAHESGVERAARNLRKQGVPLQVALQILAYK
jgi:hypothetical protein